MNRSEYAANQALIPTPVATWLKPAPVRAPVVQRSFIARLLGL